MKLPMDERTKDPSSCLGTSSSGGMPVGVTGDGDGDGDGERLLAGCREENHDLQGLIRPGGLAICDPVIPISVSIQINHRDWSECAETSNERALHVQISAVSCKSNRVRRVGQNFDQPREKP